MLTLYEHPFALYCQKVLVALNEQDVAYDVLEEQQYISDAVPAIAPAADALLPGAGAPAVLRHRDRGGSALPAPVPAALADRL
jgi:hypothetical protein